MCSALSSTLLVFCSMCLVSSVVCRAVPRQRFQRININTAKPERLDIVSGRGVVPWTPGRVKKKVQVDGRELTYRVVNGRDARPGELPYKVSIRKFREPYKLFYSVCGGALIRPADVLTAAHCFREGSVCDMCFPHNGRAEPETLKDMFVVAGALQSVTHDHSWEDSAEYGQWRELRAVRYPRTFRFPYHDVAVVTVKDSFEYTDFVQPIPYATRFKEYEGSCVMSGFGEMSRIKSDNLQVAELRVLSVSYCNKVHASDTSRYVCTTDEASRAGRGDAGGPLVCKNTGDPNETTAGILVGILAGRRSGVDGTFFTRVSSYRSFIENAAALHLFPSLALLVTALLYGNFLR